MYRGMHKERREKYERWNYWLLRKIHHTAYVWRAGFLHTKHRHRSYCLRFLYPISGTDRRPKTLKSAVQRQKRGSTQMQASLLTRSSLDCFFYARRA